jgi:hypothetical protein
LNLRAVQRQSVEWHKKLGRMASEQNTFPFLTSFSIQLFRNRRTTIRSFKMRRSVQGEDTIAFSIWQSNVKMTVSVDVRMCLRMAVRSRVCLFAPVVVLAQMRMWMGLGLGRCVHVRRWVHELFHFAEDLPDCRLVERISFHEITMHPVAPAIALDGMKPSARNIEHSCSGWSAGRAQWRLPLSRTMGGLNGASIIRQGFDREV